MKPYLNSIVRGANALAGSLRVPEHQDDEQYFIADGNDEAAASESRKNSLIRSQVPPTQPSDDDLDMHEHAEAHNDTKDTNDSNCESEHMSDCNSGGNKYKPLSRDRLIGRTHRGGGDLSKSPATSNFMGG